MATNTNRASSHSTLFFGIAASASEVRNEKRNRIANRSGAHPIEARPPQTSMIDAEWDLEPFAPAVDETEATSASTQELEPQVAAPISVRPPQTSLIDADWEALPAATPAPRAPAVSMRAPRAPRTTAIDENWEPPTVRATVEAQAKAILMSRAADLDETWEPRTDSVDDASEVPALTTPRTPVIDEDWESIAPGTIGDAEAPAVLESAPLPSAIADAWEPVVNAYQEDVQSIPAVARTQAPRGRSVAAVTFAALLAVLAFGAAESYGHFIRPRTLPAHASMLHQAALPNASAFIQEHFRANWLESGSSMASYASTALAAAEAEAAAPKPLPMVFKRRANSAATAPTQATTSDVSDPATHGEVGATTNSAPATAGEQAPTVSTPKVQPSSADEP